MGFARSAARASITGTSGIATPEKWVVDWFSGGAETDAGVRVTQETALHYSPFFAGVRVIAEDIGSLPLFLYERLEPRGKRRATDHPLYPVLHDVANPMMASGQLREVMQGHALTWGDGVAYIVANERTGQIRELWPLRPDRLTPKVDYAADGRFRRWWEYHDYSNNIHAMIPAEDVWQIPGFGFDGVRGYSIVHLARNSIGLGLATEKFGSSFFGNGARPGGVLQHPDVVSDGARKRIRADWENMHKGLDRAQRVAILEEGVTWQDIGIPPEDAQFLETRKFQVTEQARWLRLPPHKIADLERATFSNIEEQQLDYVGSALRVWLTRWEQRILMDLLSADDRRRYFGEHLIDALLRGDTAARFAAYAVGRQWGWLNGDDIREKENENPIPDGKGETYLVPLNMVPAPGPDDDPAPARHARELRGRSSAARRRIADAFGPLLEDADLRLAKLERAEVSSLVRRHLERGARSVAAFLAALQDLYEGTISERAMDRWMPVLVAFATEIVADAAADVGHEDEIDLSRWVRAYTASHVDYRVASSQGQLRSVLEQASTDDAADAVRARLDKWVDVRPGRTAKWEKTQMSSGAAREAWREAGVRRLRWITVGDNCPYCIQMDGRVVGIEQPFMSSGEQLDGLDGEKLTAGRNTYHPPMHPGCDCEVVPE